MNERVCQLHVGKYSYNHTIYGMFVDCREVTKTLPLRKLCDSIYK
jgi:hypothetical protein